MMDLGVSILHILEKKGIVNSLELSDLVKEDHQKIIGALKSLQSLGDVIHCVQKSGKQWEVTEEGQNAIKDGSHEVLVFHAIPPNGIAQSELMKIVPNAKVGFSKAMSAGWISIEKAANGEPKVTRKVGEVKDIVRDTLLRIRDNLQNDIPDSVKQELKKRKLLQEVVIKSLDVSKGQAFSTSISKPETDLTPEMLATGSWKDKTFKDYNFDALGVPPAGGHLHPLLKVRSEFRQIFLEMGFSEMATNNFVETSFWNFDALFQPQQHPARDAHDTFFISDPVLSKDFPQEYLEKVRRVHQFGGYRSQGYKYEWKLEEAQKNLMRTHTTAVSARILYKLAQQEKFEPVKYFSIDRVYRNESLDATHLAEFQQIEGIVADYGLTLGDLIGVLHEFFRKLGIHKLRFKPAYNPYTEPSMEIFSYHEGLNKWVELGNSGMFRPEMLIPMGLPKEVNVIAWGLSLERPTMIKYGINNIRDLVGHKIDLQMVYDNPICRMDKVDQAPPPEVSALEGRQMHLINKLHHLQEEVKKLRWKITKVPTIQKPLPFPDLMTPKEVVVHSSPSRPPLSLLVLLKMLANQRHIYFRNHIHSTLPCTRLVPCTFISLLVNMLTHTVTDQPRVSLTLIWKEVEEVQMLVRPLQTVAVAGEINLIRYLARHLDPAYDIESSVGTCIDQWLDDVHSCFLCASPKEEMQFLKNLNSHLSTRDWIVGKELSIADIAVFSVLQQVNVKNPAQFSSLKRWMNECLSQPNFELVKNYLSLNEA